MNGRVKLLQIGALLLLGLVHPARVSVSGPVSEFSRIDARRFCKGDNCPNMSDRSAAEAKAGNWLNRLPNTGFTLESTNDTAQYEDKTVKWDSGSSARIITIHAYGGEWPTTLHFSGPVNSSMSIAEIQARISSFSHGGFPAPGLAMANWRIRAFTPTSHVTKDIDILDVAPGYLRFRVRAKFFMLYGLDKRMPDIQDLATPQEAFFAITRTFSGEAIVTYKVANFD